MAYLPGFQHDVFISYAVADNDGPYNRKRGWVLAFQEQQKLERRMSGIAAPRAKGA